MESSQEWEIKSKIKEVLGYAPRDKDHLKDSLVEEHGFSEEDVENVLQDMIRDGTLFEPDHRSVQRT